MEKGYEWFDNDCWTSNISCDYVLYVVYVVYMLCVCCVYVVCVLFICMITYIMHVNIFTIMCLKWLVLAAKSLQIALYDCERRSSNGVQISLLIVESAPSTKNVSSNWTPNRSANFHLEVLSHAKPAHITQRIPQAVKIHLQNISSGKSPSEVDVRKFAPSSVVIPGHYLPLGL